MTPAAIMAGIPNDLLRRRPKPSDQVANAKALAYWLLRHGHRPTLLEIESERSRRANTRATPSV